MSPRHRGKTPSYPFQRTDLASTILRTERWGWGHTAAWPVATQAQQPALPVIGYIGPSPDLKSRNNAAFFRGLNEAGYADGRNVTIAYRWVEGHNDRLPGFVSELVSRRVAVIAVVDSTAAVLAAKAA